MLANNKLLEKYENGQKVCGAFFNLDSTVVVEIFAQLGLDFVVIDAEHSPYGVESAARFVMAAEVRGMTPIVRVKDANRNSILKMLDIGAKGLLIPFVKTVDEVKEIVSYGKYFP